MSKALVTFATGEHVELLELALPGMEEYAGRHHYELLLAPPTNPTRPASWHKIPALLDALEDHTEALWVDADVMILDATADLADLVPDGAYQALVRHHTADGEVPNMGVWFVRRPMRQTLKAIWAADWYLNHPWWEQAAHMELLGYSGPPAHLVYPTSLYRHTHWLPLEWNSHVQNDQHPDPRFAHATHGTHQWRLDVMRRYARAAQKGTAHHA